MVFETALSDVYFPSIAVNANRACASDQLRPCQDKRAFLLNRNDGKQPASVSLPGKGKSALVDLQCSLPQKYTGIHIISSGESAISIFSQFLQRRPAQDFLVVLAKVCKLQVLQVYFVLFVGQFNDEGRVLLTR